MTRYEHLVERAGKLRSEMVSTWEQLSFYDVENNKKLASFNKEGKLCFEVKDVEARCLPALQVWLGRMNDELGDSKEVSLDV